MIIIVEKSEWVRPRETLGHIPLEKLLIWDLKLSATAIEDANVLIVTDKKITGMFVILKNEKTDVTGVHPLESLQTFVGGLLGID